MSQFVPDIKAKNEHLMLRFIFNVNTIDNNNEQETTGILCNYIKRVYQKEAG